MSHAPLCSPEVYVATLATILVVVAILSYIAGALDDRRAERVRRAERLLRDGAEYDDLLAAREDGLRRVVNADGSWHETWPTVQHPNGVIESGGSFGGPRRNSDNIPKPKDTDADHT